MKRARPLIWLAVLSLTGCELGGFVADSFVGDKQPAIYTLEPEQTLLVLVDDPSNQLLNPSLAHTVAANTEAYLNAEEVIDQVVPQDELVRMMNEEGSRFEELAIDEVGQLMGADQVLHIKVTEVSIVVGPNINRPIALAEVKLVDADSGQRVWPEASGVRYSQADPPGYRVRTEMEYEQNYDNQRDSTGTVYRDLAEALGRDVARLFYTWRAEAPGSSLDNPRPEQLRSSPLRD